MPRVNRRRHRVFVTKHTEYHLRDNQCIGVRDRTSGTWIRHHVALRLEAPHLPPWDRGHAHLGHRIRFRGRSGDVLTSAVVAVGRPVQQALVSYVSLECSGEISGDA